MQTILTIAGIFIILGFSLFMLCTMADFIKPDKKPDPITPIKVKLIWNRTNENSYTYRDATLTMADLPVGVNKFEVEIYPTKEEESK